MCKNIQMEKQVNNSTTSQFKIIFPTALNNHYTLFGGEALKWMDEVAYITAIRFTREKMVTVSTDKIKFIKPIPVGAIVEIVGKVVKIGALKIDILVEIYIENQLEKYREKAITGVFTFVALNSKNKPTVILKN